MKTDIAYFSGTGNSLAVTRQLAKELHTSSILAIEKFTNQHTVQSDASLFGIVFPVYCQDAPGIVKRFMKKLSFEKNVYTFGIATNNGEPGYALFSLHLIFMQMGHCLNAGFEVLMPGNSIAPLDYSNPPQEQQRRIAEAKERVNAIAQIVRRQEPHPIEGTTSLRNKLKGMRNMFILKRVYRLPKQFWITDACTRCGTCAKVCPTANITVSSEGVTWNGRCEMCMACIHWCPTQAIQNGRHTQQRQRYHHPDVNVKDLFRF